MVYKNTIFYTPAPPPKKKNSPYSKKLEENAKGIYKAQVIVKLFLPTFCYFLIKVAGIPFSDVLTGNV